ncbi:MAG: hypothetical protein V7K47_27730 [Nostoc sp.]
MIAEFTNIKADDLAIVIDQFSKQTKRCLRWDTPLGFEVKHSPF